MLVNLCFHRGKSLVLCGHISNPYLLFVRVNITNLSWHKILKEVIFAPGIVPQIEMRVNEMRGK